MLPWHAHSLCWRSFCLTDEEAHQSDGIASHSDGAEPDIQVSSGLARSYSTDDDLEEDREWLGIFNRNLMEWL